MISMLYDCLQRTEKEETFSSLSETIIILISKQGQHTEEILKTSSESLQKS